jgi:hypothetical protein
VIDHAGSGLEPLDDELCTWPDRPVVFRRSPAADRWPLPVTPLTQDLVVAPQERGLALLRCQQLRLVPEPPPWTMAGCFHGWVYVDTDRLARATTRLPRSWTPETCDHDVGSAEMCSTTPVAADPPARRLIQLAALASRALLAGRQYPRDASRYLTEAQGRLDQATGELGVAPDTALAAILSRSVEEWPARRLPLYASPPRGRRHDAALAPDRPVGGRRGPPRPFGAPRRW